jgi:hypothetical protein
VLGYPHLQPSIEYEYCIYIGTMALYCSGAHQIRHLDYPDLGLVRRQVTAIRIYLTFYHYSLVVIKIIMGVNLISFATHRRADMERREAEDVVNDFGRNPIGESKDEQVSFSIKIDFYMTKQSLSIAV